MSTGQFAADLHAGKRVLVTGAARGIGLGIAQRFLREGADVLLLDTQMEALDEAIQSLSSAGGRIMKYCVDVSLEAQVRACIEEVNALWGASTSLSIMREFRQSTMDAKPSLPTCLPTNGVTSWM